MDEKQAQEIKDRIVSVYWGIAILSIGIMAFLPAILSRLPVGK